MATELHSLTSAPMQTFVFPSKATTTPSKRPSSSSALPNRNSVPSGMPSPTYSDNGASPGNSPSNFVFPMRQTATFPRSAVNLLAPTPANAQSRTPPASPTPPTATLGERRFHARRQSDIASGSKPLSLGTINQPFKFGGSVTTPSPSKSATSSPSKEGTSPKFSSQNGLLSPPPDASSPEPPKIEKGTAAPPPPGMQGRRGHAHRRSSAMSMSSADVLNMMLTAAKANNPTNTNKGAGSAPSSPASSPDGPVKESVVGVVEDVSGPVTDAKIVLEVPSSAVSCDSSASSVVNATDESVESARTSVEETPRKPRVTFSDATEIIPRPASAGTCSTFTTIRGESVSSLHGYRNSISSMEELHPIDSRGRRASASDASSTPRVPRTKTDRRPNSADAATLLNGAHKASWLFPPLSPKNPSSKKKGHAKHLSESSAAEKPKRKSRKSSNPDGTPATPKKVKGGMKGWAGTILLRRSYKKRQLKNLPRRTPTPPTMHRDEIQRLMLEGNYVLMPTGVADYEPRESSSLEEPGFEPMIDLGAYEADAEFEFPVIDLDAALGPLSTPKSPSRPLSGFESARKRMHSAAGWNCYHRRAESMPEMQLFSLAEDEIEGDGMGDVFEDTEEEDDDDDEEEEEDADLTLTVEDLPKPVMPAGLALNWDTDDSEIEELDIVDGVANVRKGIKRKMSRLSEDTDPASESQLSEDVVMKTDEALTSTDALSIPTPTTDTQLSPIFNTNNLLTKPMSNASGNVSYNSLHHASSFDQTPAVTPSTTSTSICPPTMPSTPHTSDFLLPPVPHLFYQEDDRVTIMSGASIYEDPLLLGEPGPEIRMSVSVDDIPATSHSQTKRFYPFFGGSASYSTMPDVETGSTGTPEKVKEKKEKRWSKMFSFWKGRSSTN
ncbi:hypothetical protein AOL_s00075g21 [Orbilia oligospora ATCC 24927]|uniref:Cell wall proline rich protein n=1 Tax=Arthrobotrys oligospora (strain ATCC 24927 / CBS 115.81 / DSM 1491) TaxID=756982 RepID=G1X822_ARTOA|nr:hypothetical protein AOL_s00075g21 [Orbilia oligospora ATCC 24927]EGX50595.1 hypothetical protein AOL_s00075g21 [Orbilia oligospora ATCC 24927]